MHMHACSGIHPHSYMYLFRVPVEEEIRHDIPGQVTTDGATETQNLTTEKPPHQPERVLALHMERANICEQL